MVKVKICGVTTLEDALFCAEAGADMLGLNFYPPSPRYLAPGAARALADGLRARLGDACPVLIGVFVNASAADLLATLAETGLDVAQLSGDEPVETLAALGGRGIKALRPRDSIQARDAAALYLPYAAQDRRLPTLLVDAYHDKLYGGTGEQASQDVAHTLCSLTPRMLLAGGLQPDNVAMRVDAIRPWGVDVASGVESAPGVKDRTRVSAFIAAARSAQD